MNNLIVKRKIGDFFNDEALPIVREAVEDVSNIVSKVSLLVRAYLIKEFEADPKTIITIDKDVLQVACRIVQGGKQQYRICKDKSKEKKREELHQAKQLLDSKLSLIFQDIWKDNYETSNHSLSHVLSYSLDNLLTAYENNVTTHFLKYPKRFITYTLMLEDDSLKKKAANRTAAKIVSAFMFSEPFEDFPFPKS